MVSHCFLDGGGSNFKSSKKKINGFVKAIADSHHVEDEHVVVVTLFDELQGCG